LTFAQDPAGQGDQGLVAGQVAADVVAVVDEERVLGLDVRDAD